jgi:multisubunit Na+/H+ antiporter MnhB subunit
MSNVPRGLWPLSRGVPGYLRGALAVLLLVVGTFVLYLLAAGYFPPIALPSPFNVLLAGGLGLLLLILIARILRPNLGQSH